MEQKIKIIKLEETDSPRFGFYYIVYYKENDKKKKIKLRIKDLRKKENKMWIKRIDEYYER